MLDIVVRYLHGALVPFRLASYPSEEPEPKVALPLPPNAILVDTQLVQIDGRLALTCYPTGEQIDLAAVGSELGGLAIEASGEELPDEFARAQGPIPPLGQMLGVPLILDEKVAEYGVICFRVFTQTDVIDIPYDDFARLEQPRLASIASAGELPAARPARPRASS